MAFAIKLAAAALLLFASAPAFAHGGGMGHMGGSMGGNMGSAMSGSMGKTGQPQPTMIGRHDGDHHMHWLYSKTTKVGKARIRVKTLTVQRAIRIKQEIQRLKLEIVKLRAEGRGNSFVARRLLYREMALSKLINT